MKQITKVELAILVSLVSLFVRSRVFDLDNIVRLDVDSNGHQVLRSISNIPPTSHTMKIVSFSTLQSEDRYESAEFEAGGYNWKLVLHPSGNKERNVKDHISLYLKLGGQETVSTDDWVVTFDYKLYLLDRKNGKKTYLVLEDANKEEKKYCFYQTIVGGYAGFDRFISLKDFSNASNGYLVDDTCEFGADVLVSKTRRGKGEVVLMNLNTVMYKHFWKLTDFSKLNAEYYHSEPFIAGDQKYCKWRLVLYPKGWGNGNGSHLAVFLELTSRLPAGSKIFAESTLRILDQVHGKHTSHKGRDWFTETETGWGIDRFITLEANTAFLKNDNRILEAEITVLGISIPGPSTVAASRKGFLQLGGRDQYLRL